MGQSEVLSSSSSLLISVTNSVTDRCKSFFFFRKSNSKVNSCFQPYIKKHIEKIFVYLWYWVFFFLQWQALWLWHIYFSIKSAGFALFFFSCFSVWQSFFEGSGFKLGWAILRNILLLTLVVELEKKGSNC